MQFTTDQEAFIRRAISTGRYSTPEDAVKEAMARWVEQERARFHLLAAFDEADADLESGQFLDYSDEALTTLNRELKSEARAARHRG